jgi:cysteine desulfurase
MPPIYLDHAAATPLDSGVLAAMMPYFSEQFYNPSATYLAAQAVGKDLHAARARVAAVLGARPNEITFTAGGTEANNLAIKGVIERYPAANVVVSAIEHDSVLAPAGPFCRVAPVRADGIIDIDALVQLIDERTVLVSVMYANNEVGTLQPIRQLSQALEVVRKQRRSVGNDMPLYLHTDAAQAANYLDLHVARLGVDMLSLNGGKLYGPKQTGALFVSHTLQLQPLIEGGGQERNVRSGTENVAGFIGLSHALHQAQAMRATEARRLTTLRDQFMTILETQIPGVIINGSRKHRLPNNVHITLPGQDNERLLFALDEAGVMAAAGSACSASSEEPSHVLRAMGISDADAQASLRFTLGRSTTMEQLETVVQLLQSTLHNGVS